MDGLMGGKLQGLTRMLIVPIADSQIESLIPMFKIVLATDHLMPFNKSKNICSHVILVSINTLTGFWSTAHGFN